MTKSDFICAIGGVILIFLRFSKMGTLLSISYIGMSSIPKKSANFAACARGNDFIFKTSQGP